MDAYAERIKSQIIDAILANPATNISAIPDDLEREIYEIILSAKGQSFVQRLFAWFRSLFD